MKITCLLCITVMGLHAQTEKPVALIPGLGTLSHPINTRNALAQKFFDQGLTLTYGFNRYEALRSFRKAAELDPQAVMPWWGMAHALAPYVNMDGDPSFDIKESCAAVDKGLAMQGALLKMGSTEREYLEAAAGLWCASLGFGVERLAKVAYDQMCKVGYYHIYRSSSNESAIELAAKLLEMAPVPMSKVFFQCSGSEANDTAVKVVWYYWHAHGKPEKRKIIGRKMGYHGSTCAAASISGKPDMHQESGLPFDAFRHTEFPNYYRYQLPGETEEQFSGRMAKALEDLIIAEGPDTVAAFWAEPVMGAGGAVLPPEGYFEKIQAVLRKYDVLFVADEVICGFGRTGKMWGSQSYNLQPDMISCAKALSAGLQPISALLMHERVFQALMIESDKVGHLAHGYTYAGHPLTTAVALETLKIYEERWT